MQELHDDVEYYIDNNQEADYEENPYIYDVLPVDLQVCGEGLPWCLTVWYGRSLCAPV